MKTTVHQNSIEAYYGLNLTNRQKEVAGALAVLVEATDQQIADRLGYGINRVTGRVTELKDKGVVFEVRNVAGEFGKDVRVCKLVEKERSLF